MRGGKILAVRAQMRKVLVASSWRRQWSRRVESLEFRGAHGDTVTLAKVGNFDDLVVGEVRRVVARGSVFVLDGVNEEADVQRQVRVVSSSQSRQHSLTFLTL
jgi:hypothetical protein